MPQPADFITANHHIERSTTKYKPTPQHTENKCLRSLSDALKEREARHQQPPQKCRKMPQPADFITANHHIERSTTKYKPTPQHTEKKCLRSLSDALKEREARHQQPPQKCRKMPQPADFITANHHIERSTTKYKPTPQHTEKKCLRSLSDALKEREARHQQPPQKCRKMPQPADFITANHHIERSTTKYKPTPQHTEKKCLRSLSDALKEREARHQQPPQKCRKMPQPADCTTASHL